MKRHIVLIVLLAVVMAASTVMGQGSFPPKMAGDQLHLGDLTLSTTMVYTGAYNLPWSMPDIVGYEVPVAVEAKGWWFLLVDVDTGREYYMTWVEDCGCYASWVFTSPDKIKYVSMTITTYYGDNWTGTFRDGQLVFTGHPPQFWDFDGTYPMLTAQVNPIVIVPPAERAGAQRAND